MRAPSPAFTVGAGFAAGAGFLCALVRFFFFFSFFGLLLFFLLFRFFFFRFGFLSFFLLFFRRSFFLGRFFVLTADERNFVADVYLATFFDINLSEHSIFGRLPFHRRLIGLNFGEHLTGQNLVAFLFFPSNERSLRHRVAQFGHLDF